MPITNGYATLSELRAWQSTEATTFDPEAERAIEAASRWVDSETDRHFWQVSEARLFDACSPDLVNLGAYGDLVSVTSLQTDSGGDGVFEVTWGPSDYQLLPVRRTAAPETKPYRQVVALTRSFPMTTSRSRFGRVRIEGVWGWPAIPTAIKQATLIQAARLLNRKDSPEGVTGFGSEFGAIRLSARPDPDAVNLIAPYRLYPVLVG